MGSGPRTTARDVFATAKVKTSRASLVLDGDLLDEHALADQDLADVSEAHGTDSPEAAAAAQHVLDLEEALAAAEVEFVFKGIGRGRWRKLKADHPPSVEQVERGATFDVDEFPFHVMAISLVEPAMTVDELKRLNDDVLDEAQFNVLWGACLEANVGSVNRPESAAARSVIQSARPRSVPPSSSESAEAS